MSTDTRKRKLSGIKLCQNYSEILSNLQKRQKVTSESEISDTPSLTEIQSSEENSSDSEQDSNYSTNSYDSDNTCFSDTTSNSSTFFSDIQTVKTPSVLLNDWKLRTFHKWIHEPNFESIENLLFVKNQPDLVLNVFNNFVTQEYLEKHGLPLIPYYTIALIQSGVKLNLKVLIKKTKWVQVFKNKDEKQKNLNLTSYFLRIINLVKNSETSNHFKEQKNYQNLFISCFKYLFKNNCDGAVSLALKYCLEFHTPNSYYNDGSAYNDDIKHDMLKHLFTRYQARVLKNSDIILSDNLRSVFVKSLKYRPCFYKSGTTAKQPRNNIETTLMDHLVRDFPELFNNLAFLNFLFKHKIQNYEKTVPPIICSKILYENTDWAVIKNSDKIEDYILASVKTQDIFSKPKLKFLHKFGNPENLDENLLKLLMKHDGHVLRLSTELANFKDKNNKIYLQKYLNGIFFQKPCLKYLSLHDSPETIVSQPEYRRSLSLALQFFQPKKVAMNMLLKKCLCTNENRFKAFYSCIHGSKTTESLVKRFVVQEAFQHYFVNCIVTFLTCMNEKCWVNEFYLVVDKTLTFQSGISLIGLINRFFDKLPRSGFTKDRVKTVVRKFAEAYAKMDKNTVESNHKIDKMIIIDYINKCINPKIQKLVTETFL